MSINTIFNDWERSFVESDNDLFTSAQLKAEEEYPYDRDCPTFCRLWWIKRGYNDKVTTTGLPKKYAKLKNIPYE